MTGSKKGELSKSKKKKNLESRAIVKKRRKSQSQKRNLESRAMVKSKSNAKKRDEVTHSTGLVFIEPKFMDRSVQIGRFTFQPLIPSIHNLNVADAFEYPEDYGKYAPFRTRLVAELTTCEKDWENVVIGNERFTDLDSKARFKLIVAFSSNIILLLRLRGFTNFITPFDITGSTFQELSRKSGTVELNVRSVQSLIDFLPTPNLNPILPQMDDFEWIENNILTINQLNRDGRMNFIHDLYDVLNFPNLSVQFMAIWSGIESIILSESDGVRKSIQSRCAMILEGDEEKQKSRFKRIGKLYEFRCKVIHGNENFDMLSINEDVDMSDEVPKISGNAQKFYESYQLLTDLLLKVLERGRFWTREELREIQDKYPSRNPM